MLGIFWRLYKSATGPNCLKTMRFTKSHTRQVSKSSNCRWISLTMCCPVPSPVPNIAATGADGVLESLSDWLLVDLGQKPLLKSGKSHIPKLVLEGVVVLEGYP